MNVRILARWEDDPLESPITLDARLDAGGGQIAGGEILFGATNIGTPQARPFCLDPNGVIDFGEGRPEADRYWRCDIRACAISRGATFHVTWSGGECGVYRIEKIARPGSRGG